ncbi:hypothetical protein [Ekhidna sp.]
MEESLFKEEDFEVNDFRLFIDENPDQGQILGNIDASTKEGQLTFTLDSQSPGGAIEVDENSGAITIADASLFVFADNPEITASVTVKNGTNEKNVEISIFINDPGVPNFTIWTGSKLTFLKQDGADAGEATNQDRITDNVWITRGNGGGQIFNIKEESEANKASSPKGTEWARGTTENIANLNFVPFRDAIAPKNVVGENLVLHLITDDVYLDVTFLSWTQDKRGGFSYERSTEN